MTQVRFCVKTHFHKEISNTQIVRKASHEVLAMLFIRSLVVQSHRCSVLIRHISHFWIMGWQVAARILEQFYLLLA